MDQLLNEIAICIIAAWLLALVAQCFRQPVLLAYLAAGFVIGPMGFKLIGSEESVRTISELGLVLLLFMIGLEIDRSQDREAAHPVRRGCCASGESVWAA